MIGSEGLEPIGMKAGLLKFILTIGSADSCSVQKSATHSKRTALELENYPIAHTVLMESTRLIHTFTIDRVCERFNDHS